jgi:hypothetical protein
MGLLDGLFSDDARLGIGLLAAGGYQPTKMSFGQRVAQALQGEDARKQGALQAKLLEAQVASAGLKDSPYAKIDPSKFTPESIAAFSASGGRDFTKLVPVRNLSFQNTGTGIVGLDPTNGNLVGTPLPISVSPDTSARLAQDAQQFGSVSGNTRATLDQNDRQFKGVSGNTQAQLTQQMLFHNSLTPFQRAQLQLQGNEAEFNTGQNPLGVAIGTPPAIAVPPAMPSAPAAPAAQPGRTGTTLDLNNPGGLRPVGASTGFQSFPDANAGIQALTGNLRAYGDRGINTIERIVSTWAPSNENDTKAYIGHVSRMLGIPANQPLDMKNPYVLHGLTTAIMTKEQGPRLFTGTSAPAARGITPKIAAENAGKIELDRQKSAQELPKIISQSENALRYVDELVGSEDGKTKPHPGFQTAVGATAFPGLKYVPGTDTRSFLSRLDQLKGGAFLEAFEALKGGGQITEVEGAKATSAITRMDTATSEKEFTAAARDYQNVIRGALKRAKDKAGGNVSSANTLFGESARKNSRDADINLIQKYLSGNK